MSCNQQPNITGTIQNSRAPISTTAGYSIQESRRRMLETIDRRRNEMLNASNAAAAAAASALSRGPQIGMVGTTGSSAMPRLQSASSLIRNYDQHQQHHQPPSSTIEQQQRLAAAMNSNRRSGFVNSIPTPNGGSFTHMRFSPGRGGAPVQQQQQQQAAQQLQQQANSASRSHPPGPPGSLAAVPAGAMRAYAAAAAAAATVLPSASGVGLSSLLNGTAPRYAPPNTIVQAAADSSMASRQAHQQSSRARSQQLQQQQQQQQQQLLMQQQQVQQQQHQQQRARAAVAAAAAVTTASNVPTHTTQIPPSLPDIAVQPHPFYDHLAPVMPPTALLPLRLGQRMQTVELTFTLTQEQAETVALTRIRHPLTQRTDYGVQVQLRCFKIAPGPQPDCFPPGISLAVNKNQVTTLPPVLPTNKLNSDPMRPGRPVNISGHCRISHAVLNRLTLSWLHDPSVAGYCVTVGLVRALTAEHLTERLLAETPISHSETRARIVELLGGGSGSGSDEVISMTDLTASLRCPLSRGRIRIPARGVACSHIQCFDAPTFLAMNERKPNWRCPCCDRQLPLADLRVDNLFRDILAAPAAASPVEIVRFLPDGGWAPVADSPGCGDSAPAAAPAANAAVAGAPGDLIVDLTEESVQTAAPPPPPPPPPASFSTGVAGAVAKPPQPATAKAAAPAAAAAAASAKRPADSCGPDGILVITLDSSDDEADEDSAAPLPPPVKRPHLSASAARPGSGCTSPAASGTPCYGSSSAGFSSSISSSPPATVDFINTAHWPGFSGVNGHSLMGGASSLPGRSLTPGDPRSGCGSPATAAAPSSATAAPQPPPQRHLEYATSGDNNIPLPPAFMQDQQRLSALLAATAFNHHHPRHQLQQQQHLDSQRY